MRLCWIITERILAYHPAGPFDIDVSSSCKPCERTTVRVNQLEGSNIDSGIDDRLDQDALQSILLCDLFLWFWRTSQGAGRLGKRIEATPHEGISLRRRDLICFFHDRKELLVQFSE